MTDKIYYADKIILDKIREDFSLIDEASWLELYQNKADLSYWRLDKFDKGHEQFFVRLNTKENWADFDDRELRIQLLLKTRGATDNICAWIGCERKALQNLVFCEKHAYEEMGIRK